MDQDQVADIEENRQSLENSKAFEVITIAMGIERHARSMRLGTVDPGACALAIVELLKRLPWLPE